MCGLAGWVGESAGEHVLERMTAALAHRGPDDRGHWRGEGAWLGHRRLAVIDPSPGGHQPMQHGLLTLVYNGELYNYRYLRGELQKARRSFRTRSDTEVLLQGLEEWGLDGLLQRADGMFAFAAWDAGARRLMLARDRMGEKPLYWAEVPGGLAFASELTSLVEHPAVSREVDPVSLRKYLAYDYVPAPRSMLRGVSKLEAAHLLVWERGRIVRSEAWWEMPTPTGTLQRPREAAETLWEAIRSGVRSRLVSDVPLGVFLSGGLDSTAVAAAARELGGDVDTFCVGFDDPSFDESEHARVVADALGTRHHEERLTAGAMLGLIPEVLGRLDEPLADPSLVPTSLLAQFARQHVTVALGGDGGDELLLGYPTFGAHRVAAAAERIPGALRRGLLRPALRQLPASERNWSLDYKAKRFVDGLEYERFARHFVWIGGTDPTLHRDLLEPAAFAAGDVFDDVERLRARWPGRGRDEVAEAAYLYARLYLAEGVLQKVDRATMAYGLESRAPLLAEEVVTTAARIPTDLKLRRGTTKWILRRALKGRVPEHIVARPKKGFGMPLTAWLKGPLLPLARETLDATALRTQALFKAESVERLLQEHLSGWRDHRKTLWALIVFQLWWQRLTGRA